MAAYDPVSSRVGDGFPEEVTCKLQKVYQQREQQRPRDGGTEVSYEGGGE